MWTSICLWSSGSQHVSVRIASDPLLGKLAAFVTGLLVTMVDTTLFIIVLLVVFFSMTTWWLMNSSLRDQLMSQENQTYPEEKESQA